jgi:predicted membrane protein
MDDERWRRKMHRFESRMNRFERRWERRWDRRSERRRSSSHGLFLGVFMLGIGVLFLLGNMGAVDVGYVLRFWPLGLVALGVLKLVESGEDYAHSSGIFWIVIGGLFFLGNIGVLQSIFSNFWPIVLIGLGSLMLWKHTLAQREPRNFPPDPDVSNPGFTASTPTTDSSAASDTSTGKEEPRDEAASSDSLISAMAILGSVKRRNNCQDFRGGSATAFMGGCEIDLRGASITSPHEPIIEVFSMWGGIEIRVPPDWKVVSDVSPIMGSYEDDTQPPKETSKRLRIRGAVVMGGIEVTT